MHLNNNSKQINIVGSSVSILIIASTPILFYWNLLFFHTLIEIFCVVISYSIFIITWNAKDKIKNSFIVFLGTGMVFVSFFDLLHSLSFPGLNIFPNYNLNLSLKFWIYARFIQQISFFLTINMITKENLNPIKIFFIYFASAIVLTITAFVFKPPIFYIESKGLTSAKIFCEYLIIGSSIILIFLFKRKRFSLKWNLNSKPYIFILIAISEIFFIFYKDPTEWFVYFGHMFKLFYFILIYKNIVILLIKQPQNTIFLNLINELKSLQNEKKHLNKKLKKEIEKSKVTLSFISHFSHEIRSNLQVIVGYAEILKEGYTGKLSTDQQDFIKNIVKASYDVIALLNKMLNISRIERGKISPKYEEINLYDTLKEILEINRLKSIQENININFNYNTDIKTIKTDKILFKELIYIFIDNAIKYTPIGNIGIDVFNDEYLSIIIWDEGIGISSENLNKLFKEFSRIHTNNTKQIKGMGIGLFYAKKISDALHYKIDVESEENKGSKFKILIPPVAELPKE
ncbi:MAG: MASE3 domain-containing protein [Promethearchaeota archaeon]